MCYDRGNTGTYDIDLLEVVEDWSSSDRFAEFNSTESLQMRGKLRLFFLRQEEFEHPERIKNGKMRQWVVNLLQRVQQGYEIIYEYPLDYAHNVLEGVLPMSEATPLASGALAMPDPFKLPTK